MEDNNSSIWISKLDSFTIKRFIMTDNYNPQELHKEKNINKIYLSGCCRTTKKIQDILWSSVFLYWHLNKSEFLPLPSSRYRAKDTRPDLEKYPGSDTCIRISKNRPASQAPKSLRWKEGKYPTHEQARWFTTAQVRGIIHKAVGTQPLVTPQHHLKALHHVTNLGSNTSINW